jgi:hypothetical protein
MCLLVLFGPQNGNTQTQAALAGRVLSDAGNPVNGARVFYNRNAKYKALVCPRKGYPERWGLAEPQVAGSVKTGPDGRFTLPALPDGNYRICVTSPTPGMLDTCSWTGATTFSVVQGRALAIPDIHMTSGTEIHIRINDPAQLGLPARNGPAKLSIGVLESNHVFHSVPQVARDATGREHSITVPQSTPLKLWLFSRSLKIQDATNNAVDTRGYRLPVQAAAGKQRLDYVFHVVGTK